MHITVVCPHCQSRYQLDPSLAGKRMRCPNTICQAVFEVRPEREGAAGITDKRNQKNPALQGSVGDVVPVLPVENIPAATSNLEAVAPVGFSVPLIADKEGGASAVVKPAEAQSDASFAAELGIPDDDADESPQPREEIKDASREMPPGTWQPPPVRGAGFPMAEPFSDGKAPVAAAARVLARSTPRPPTVRLWRRPIIVIVAMALVLATALVGGVLLVSSKGEHEEADRFEKARALYHNQDFAEAREAFQKLLRDFPTSNDRRQFDFMVELSAVREAVYTPTDDGTQRAAALPSILQFVEIYKNDAQLKEYQGDVWLTLQRLARDLTTLAEQKQDVRYLEQAKRSWTEAGKFTPPTGAQAHEMAQTLQADFTRVDGLLAARAARLGLLDKLQTLVTRASADAVREGRARVQGSGLEHDADVVRLLAQLVQAHRAQVVFTSATRADRDPSDSAVALEDNLPSFYAAPSIGKGHPRASKQSGEHNVVFALARGVLYALEATSGDVLWLRRVGADTNLLPLRVSRTLIGPEMVLVLSSDYKVVSGVLATTGAEVWRHSLEGVCIGQPVLVDRQLLVPTLSGRVEEIEITGGQLQGSYNLGQPLPLGGVRQPGTSLVYFPADAYSVYVLDVAKRACAAILYTGHAAGSLRGLPLIWNEVRAPNVKGGGWLLVTLASGNDGVEMRPYRLPIGDSDQKPAKPQVRVRGDSWSAPWHDSEKLALATSTGLLALYGIRLPGDRDPLLFPLLDGAFRLEHTAPPSEALIGGSETIGARALVVHADAQNYWVLTAGKLQRLQATFTAEKGPGLVARWPQPALVGSPLHAGQIHVGPDGAVTLILVTQDADQATCWARALDAEDGRIVWQRQLGLVCQIPPVAADDAILCTDATGAFLFDATRFSTDKRWQAASLYQEGDAKRTNHWTCALAGGFVELAWGINTDLRVCMRDGHGVETHKSYSIPAPPQGTPALGSNFVLVPLANGIVYRVPLPSNAEVPASGPDWRGMGVDESQPGHIVALGDDDFAITDGGRSVFRLHWDKSKSWNKTGSADLPRRIVAPPVVVGKRLLVADASDTVYALDGNQLRPEHWTFGSKITAGPFARGPNVAVIVNNTRLVWLDTSKDQPVWEYTFVAPIVGQPELIEGLLVVADLQGGIVGLDPLTGNPMGPGYHLKANEAPTAAPLPFGAGQVFMPLMDGTAMVLPIAKLRQ